MRDLVSRLFKGKSNSPSDSKAFENSGLVVFSEGAAYWNTFKPIIEALVRRNFSFIYITMDKNDPAFAVDSPFIKAVFLGGPVFAPAKFATQKAKVMLATTPNIGTRGYPLPRPQFVGCMAHIFHSVADGSLYHKGSLDNYDVVLTIGNFAEKGIREIESLRGLKRKDCVALGLPYLDVLAENAAQQAAPKKEEGQPTILMAPSWGKKGFLSVYGHEFIRQLAEKGYNIIVRPHPQSKISEAEMLDEMKLELAPYKNVHIDEEIDGTVSMAAADVLISDNSSIRFDYAFIYCRPVITLEVPAQNFDVYERADMKYNWETDVEKELGAVIPWGEYSSEALGPKLDESLKALKQLEASKIETIRDNYIANYRGSGDAIAAWAIEACLGQ